VHEAIEADLTDNQPPAHPTIATRLLSVSLEGAVG